MSKKDAIKELRWQLDQLKEIHDECVGIIEEHFPLEVNKCKSYEILDFGWSSNPHNKTLETFIEDLVGVVREEEELANYDGYLNDLIDGEGK
jgi:hypothetical protein